jgi:hypothetical protein
MFRRFERFSTLHAIADVLDAMIVVDATLAALRQLPAQMHRPLLIHGFIHSPARRDFDFRWPTSRDVSGCLPDFPSLRTDQSAGRDHHAPARESIG